MHQNDEQREDAVLEVDLYRLLQNLLRAFKRLWFLVIIAMVLCAGAVMFFQQKSYTPTYKAYCSFAVRVINKSTMSETNSLYAVYYDKDLAEQLDKTFTYILNSDLLNDDVKTYLGTNSLQGNISANCIEGSNIFVLTTYSSTPEEAERLLRAVMSVYEDAARYVIGDLETDVIEEPVASETPYNSPSKAKGIILGGVLGLFLSVALLALYAFFKRTVLVPEDLEKYLNLPCFGVVPIVNMKQLRRPKGESVSATHEEGVFKESIKGIARKLDDALALHQGKTVLVTSTVPGEGKSMMSYALAEVFAGWGKRVVLMDCDLRKPSLYKNMGLKNVSVPLVDVINGKVSEDKAIYSHDSLPLKAVLNTNAVEDASVAINSEKMAKFVSRMEAEADIVIIDSSPCGSIIDAAMLQQYADSVFYVIQQDKVPVTDIVDAVENLCFDDNKLVGYALNGAEASIQGYGKYGYGKYGYGKYGYGGYGYNRYSYNKYGYGERRETEAIQDKSKTDGGFSEE